MSNFTYCYGLIRFKTLAYCSLFSGTFLSNGLNRARQLSSSGENFSVEQLLLGVISLGIN